MIFTSWTFLIFFSVVLAGLWIAPNRRFRQLLILAASIYFYAYWSPVYLLLLAAPSVIDYFCALFISQTAEQRRRRIFLWISVVSNIGLLVYFKYTNFFLSTTASILGREPRILDITLPVGISFFTFKALSYTIDVYRNELEVCRDWWQYAMFITYFPELIAGPIVRASVFLPQIHRSLRPSLARTFVGLQVIALGATKKVLIADRLAPFADLVFSNPTAYSPATVLSAVIAYSLQIYCDFSGYSDMAIGVSKIIGFDLPENFNMPYLAVSLSDFWRRWHITLSSWLRDYLYIPLGGNRGSERRTYVNLMLTMLLGGLWHGANWTFVVWGLLHGVGLAVSRALNPMVRVPKFVAWFLTYCFVCVTWIFFRSQSFSVALLILRNVFWIDRTGFAFFYSPLFMILPFVVLGHVFGVLAQRRSTKGVRAKIEAPRYLQFLYRGYASPFAFRPHKWAGLYVLLPRAGFTSAFIATCWLIVIFLFASLNTSPFIYFQF